MIVASIWFFVSFATFEITITHIGVQALTPKARVSNRDDKKAEVSNDDDDNKRKGGSSRVKRKH
jgi:hypothetical protein